MRLTYNLFIYYLSMGNSLVVQWLRFHAFIAGGTSSIPGWGTKIPHAAWCGQKNKNKNKNKLSVIFYLCNIFFFPFGHILEIMDQPLRCILEPNICPLKEEIQTSCFLIQNYEGKNIMRF